MNENKIVHKALAQLAVQTGIQGKFISPVPFSLSFGAGRVGATSLAIGFYKKISTFRFAMLRKFRSLPVMLFSKKPCIPALPAFWLPIAGQMWRFAANVKSVVHKF